MDKETDNKQVDETLEEEQTEDSAGSESTAQNEENEGSKDDKTFSQADVSRMMTKEKRQGRNSAYNELGISPDDKETIAMVKAFVQAKSGESEEQETTELDEANHRALVAEAKAEAMMQGVQTKYVDDLVILALNSLEEDGDLKTVISEFKTKYPVWFERSDEDEKKQATSKGTGSSISTAKADGKKQEGGLGARLAAQRKSSSAKSSYWGNGH